MLKADFNEEYKLHFKERCPVGISKEPKMLGCFNSMERFGDYPRDEKCKRCWWTYINQQEPDDNGEVQGELFKEQIK